MLLFVHGTESYRIHEQFQEWLRQYRSKHKSGLNEVFFDIKDFNIEEFRNYLNSTSMFGEKKLIVLRNIFSSPPIKESLLKILKNPSLAESKDTFLIFVQHLELSGEKRQDIKKIQEFQKDKLFKYLQEKSYQIKELNRLDDASLSRWILNEFEKRHAQIDKAALNFLLNNFPKDLWFLSQEIEKLSLYSQKVTLKEIKELTSEHVIPDIFKTIDALGQKNKKLALTLLHQHLKKGDSPLQLLSMLIFQFRNIYLLKKLKSYNKPVPKSLKLHPFVQKKALLLGRNFTLQELQNIYQKLFETDLAIKTGQLEPETALDLLVAKAF